MKVLKKNVTEACDYLDKNFESEFETCNRQNQHAANMCQQSSEILFSDGESSFGESSLNQVFIFEYFQLLQLNKVPLKDFLKRFPEMNVRLLLKAQNIVCRVPLCS